MYTDSKEDGDTGRQRESDSERHSETPFPSGDKVRDGILQGCNGMRLPKNNDRLCKEKDVMRQTPREIMKVNLGREERKKRQGQGATNGDRVLP